MRDRERLMLIILGPYPWAGFACFFLFSVSAGMFLACVSNGSGISDVAPPLWLTGFLVGIIGYWQLTKCI